MKRIAWVLLLGAAVLFSVSAAPKIKMGYACKILTHPWFQLEEMGMKEFAKGVGMEVVSMDANMDDERLSKIVDQLIAQKINALVVCLNTASMGPSLAAKAAAAKIPIIAIDDAFNGANGEPVPYVGMPNYEIGSMGGKAVAKAANERGFFKAGNVVKVINIGNSKAPVVMERCDGFRNAIIQNTPLKDEDFIFAESDGFMESALKAVSAIVSANPQVTYWIATGPNDDCGVAAVRTFEEMGVERSNYISCGICGYDIALEEFSAGNTSYLSVGTYSNKEGYKAAEMIYQYLANKRPLEQTVFVGGQILTTKNYKESSFFPFWKKK